MSKIQFSATTITTKMPQTMYTIQPGPFGIKTEAKEAGTRPPDMRTMGLNIPVAFSL